MDGRRFVDEARDASYSTRARTRSRACPEEEEPMRFPCLLDERRCGLQWIGSRLTAAALALLSAGPASAQPAEVVAAAGGTVRITRPGSYRLGHDIRVAQDAA